VRLVLHQGIPDDHTLAHQWDELVQQMECPEVFYTYAWALAVSRAYGHSLSPLLMLGYEQDSLVGVASLATNAGQARVVFLASTTADYCDFVSRPESRRDFAELVFGELRRMKMPMSLANVSANSLTLQALPVAAHLAGYSMFSRPAYRCAQVVLSSPAQREAARQLVQQKQKLRKRLRAIAKIAPLEILHLRQWEKISAALPAFEQAHISRFLDSGRVSNLASDARRIFLAELAKLLSRRGWLNLTCLNVGDETAAWNYGFEFAASWFWYQPTFTSRFHQHDPGLCLLTKIVEEACERPEINRVDLGLGAEGYKERFATGVRNTVDVTLTTSKARHIREVVRYHAVSAIKSSPQLEHYVRRLLGRTRPGEVHA
jgi:CelD/BcsL family acetyltransferase involved in cellulose biosynthesis